jgi:hypothetical protein
MYIANHQTGFKPQHYKGGIIMARKIISGRLKGLGLFESFHMKRIGCSDGKVGLPRPNTAGQTDSPLFSKEASAYQEFCTKKWTDTEVALESSYKEAGQLMSAIDRKEEDLEKLRHDEPQAPDESQLTARAFGEEKLTDDQIRSRRLREFSKKNAPYYAKIKAIEEEIAQSYERLEELINHILEVNNITRLVCERVQRHTEQRRLAYWDAVLRTHPQRREMPVTPDPLPKSEAELTYTSAHAPLEDEANAMLERRKRLSRMQNNHKNNEEDD